MAAKRREISEKFDVDGQREEKNVVASIASAEGGGDHGWWLGCSRGKEERVVEGVGGDCGEVATLGLELWFCGKGRKEMMNNKDFFFCYAFKKGDGD